MPQAILARHAVKASRPIPRKLFYRIREVAEIVGVEPHVLRYWETEFKHLAPEKDKNDQRRYRRSDLETVLEIKDLLYRQKFTIAGARQQIQAARRNSKRDPRPAALRSIRAELCDLMNQLSA